MQIFISHTFVTIALGARVDSRAFKISAIPVSTLTWMGRARRDAEGSFFLANWGRGGDCRAIEREIYAPVFFFSR